VHRPGRGPRVNSCLMLAAEVAGGEMTTNRRSERERKAQPPAGRVPCPGRSAVRFCIPGQVMAAHQLLRRNPHPALDEVKEGPLWKPVSCGGYVQICEAVIAGRRVVTADRSALRSGGMVAGGV